MTDAELIADCDSHADDLDAELGTERTRTLLRSAVSRLAELQPLLEAVKELSEMEHQHDIHAVSSLDFKVAATRVVLRYRELQK